MSSRNLSLSRNDTHADSKAGPDSQLVKAARGALLIPRKAFAHDLPNYSLLSHGISCDNRLRVIAGIARMTSRPQNLKEGDN